MYSHFRSLIAILAITIFAQGAFAHTYLSAVYLNNQLLAENDCMRKHPTTTYDSPISSLTSPDMSCGFLPAAQPGANRMCPITAGSSIGLQWHHSSNSPSDDIVDPSHVGPVIFYLGKINTDLSKVSWFKIYEDGFANGKWAVNRLIANKGRVDITIPSDIAAGNYLLRGEVLALHNGYELNGVQPYVGCVELAVSGGGSANPAGVLIPGAYKPTDPGMLFNVYQSFTSYPIPGPAIYKSGPAPQNPATNPPVATQKPSTPVTPVTSAPVTAAPATAAPVTAAPKPAGTPAPSKPAAGGIQVQMHAGSSSYWVGVTVLGGSETTVKVEVMDSGSLSGYTALVDQSYAFVFGAGKPLVLPLSLRLTSSNGKQIVLTNVFSSFSSSALVNSGVNYGSNAEVTPKPSTPTTPTTPASTGNAQFTIHSGANPWWFALNVNGVSGATVSVKDSTSSTFAEMKNEGWAYTYSANGKQIVAPLVVRITANGKTVDTTLATISPSQVVTANGQL